MSSVIVQHVGTAWVSARPLQPSVASQYKSTPIPRRRLAVRKRAGPPASNRCVRRDGGGGPATHLSRWRRKSRS